MMAWAMVIGVLMGLASLVAWLIAARFLVEWWDERTYKPRMRRGE
jgi:hypothetical protein